MARSFSRWHPRCRCARRRRPSRSPRRTRPSRNCARAASKAPQYWYRNAPARLTYLGILAAGVGLAEEIARAFRAAAGLQARGDVGEVLALARRHAIGRALAALGCARRPHMVEEAAMLVIGEEDDGVLPMRAVADGV